MMKEVKTGETPKDISSSSKEEGDFNIAIDLLSETIDISQEGEVNSLIEKVKDGVIVMRHILMDMIQKPEFKMRTITVELLWKQLLVAIDSVAELDKIKIEQEKAKIKCEIDNAAANYIQEINALSKQLEGAKAQSRSQMWMLKNALKNLREERVIIM